MSATENTIPAQLTMVGAVGMVCDDDVCAVPGASSSAADQAGATS